MSSPSPLQEPSTRSVHPPTGGDAPEPASGWSRMRRVLGPGILFAGASIGVSHLVQATQAGATFGLAMVLVVVVAHLVKFPGLSFGCLYAAATGRSLIEAYRAQGRHAIVTLWAVTLGTMFTIVAAIMIVTAATVRAALSPVLDRLGWSPEIWMIAAGLGLLCTAIIAVGGFRWLDRVMKALMVAMLALTLVAAGLQLPGLIRSGTAGDGAGLVAIWPSWAVFTGQAAFIVALVGWMPAPLDISVWNSLWTVERERQTSYRGTRSEVSADFLIGFTLTVVLALSFLVLGASLLHNRGIELKPTPGAFVTQVIDLYTASMGGWVRPIIGIGAVAVMFSTLLTVIDAIPRVLTALVLGEGQVSTSGRDRQPRVAARRGIYWGVHALLLLGGVLIVVEFSSNLPRLVNIATTLSFLSTPVLAVFNHRAMFRTRGGAAVPPSHRPGRLMHAWSWASIALLSGFAAWFLALRVAALLGS